MSRVTEHFGRTAEVYAREETRRYPQDLILGLTEPSDDDRLLDLGTGPGTLVEIIGPHVGSSVGVDVTTEMLQLFRVRTKGAHPVLADASRLPFPDRSFDLVTCGSVFHHLDDPADVAHELARVTRKGGRFLLIDMAGPEHRVRRAIRDEVERIRDPSHVGILPPSRVRAILDDAGFKIRSVERQAEDKRDEDWVRVAGADLPTVRAAFERWRRVAAGFLALRSENGAFVFRRERGYYLSIRR